MPQTTLVRRRTRGERKVKNCPQCKRVEPPPGYQIVTSGTVRPGDLLANLSDWVEADDEAIVRIGDDVASCYGVARKLAPE
jgi:hypothetical protein